MARYGSWRAYAASDFRGELAESAGFGDLVLPRLQKLHIDEFVGLALSSSHAAGLVERLASAHDQLRSLLALPRRTTSIRTMWRSATASPV